MDIKEHTRIVGKWKYLEIVCRELGCFLASEKANEIHEILIDKYGTTLADGWIEDWFNGIVPKDISQLSRDKIVEITLMTKYCIACEETRFAIECIGCKVRDECAGHLSAFLGILKKEFENRNL